MWLKREIVIKVYWKTPKKLLYKYMPVATEDLEFESSEARKYRNYRICYNGEFFQVDIGPAGSLLCNCGGSIFWNI